MSHPFLACLPLNTDATDDLEASNQDCNQAHVCYICSKPRALHQEDPAIDLCDIFFEQDVVGVPPIDDYINQECKLLQMSKMERATSIREQSMKIVERLIKEQEESKQAANGDY